MDVPLVNHVSQMVSKLASRPDAGQHNGEDLADQNKITDGKSPKTHLPTPPKSPRLNDWKRIPKRKPIRNYRVRPAKTDPWKEQNTVLYGVLPPEAQKSKKEYAEKSRVDPKLGSMDPFDAFQLPKNSTTDMALHHWTNVFQETRMPITPRKAWLRINLEDKTLLSVTSYCSTYHYYFIRRAKPPPPCLVQKANAIRNINNDLQRPGLVPSDHLLVAVAVMTLLECLAGEPTASIIHRRGLQLMVKTRGGLQNLGFNGAAQRTISWADIACATLMREKPSLKPILIPTLGESESTTITNFSSGTLNTRLLALTTSKHLTKGMIYIWLRLRYLTDFLSDHGADIDNYFFSDKIDFIERQILSLIHSDRLSKTSSAAFVTAFLNAALIYVIEELRECPKWTNVCICLSERIFSGLKLVDLNPVAEMCPDLLVWVLMLGRSGNSPMGEVSRLWFGKVIGDVEGSFWVPVPGTVVGMKYFEIAEEVARRAAVIEEREVGEGEDG